MFRGWVHLLSAVVAPFALLWLVLAADSPRAYVGGAIFGASFVVLFVTSAAFHVVPWRPRAKAFVRRIDQSVIFLVVAGAYTPFCLLLLGTGWGVSILSIVGTLALLGILVSQIFPQAPRRVSVSMYLAVAWVAVAAAPIIAVQLPMWAFLTLIGAGAMFSLGALAYAFRWPNPVPRYFGFHEVFHTAVTVAAAMLFVVVLESVLPR
jgi:hemolysin III